MPRQKNSPSKTVGDDIHMVSNGSVDKNAEGTDFSVDYENGSDGDAHV